MRSDNRVMRDISSHTRVSPNDRGRELQNFLEVINKNEVLGFFIWSNEM